MSAVTGLSLFVLFAFVSVGGGVLLALLVQDEGRGETMSRGDAERRARRDVEEEH